MRKLLLTIIVTFVALALSTSSATAQNQTKDTSHEVIVKFKSTQLAEKYATAYTTRSVYGMPDIRVVTVSDTKSAVEGFAKNSDVEWAKENALATISDDPVSIGEPYFEFGSQATIYATNDPLRNQQYSFDLMQIDAAHAVTHGDGVVIGIVDTGADFTHPDLQGKFVSHGKDFVNGDDDATDDNGHGTHVSGIAAGATNNGVGIAGVGYNAKFLMCKGLAANGSGGLDVVASCVNWLADQPEVKVINMSLGCLCPHPIHEEYINYAWNKGKVVIVAAGNDNDGTHSYFPASVNNAIGVGAVDGSKQKASFSNYGPNVDVVTPGVNILSTVRGGRYESWNGTSMASPNAAGVAALVFASRPNATNVEVRNRLEATADSIGPANLYGRGLLNAARAVSGGSVSPTPTPVSPVPTSPAPTATPVPSDNPAMEVVALINVQRANNSLPPLRYDARLGGAGLFHVNWMADNNCFDHNCPNEPPVMTRMRNAGYPVISGGENIAAGYDTPQKVVTAWMNSSGHRAAILTTYWFDIGCAYVLKPNTYYRYYWACEFAKSNESQPPPSATPTIKPPTPTRIPTVLPTSTRFPTPTTPPSSPDWRVIVAGTDLAQPSTVYALEWWCDAVSLYASCQRGSDNAYTYYYTINIRRGVSLGAVYNLVALCRSDDYLGCKWLAPTPPWN